jgi:hypothetical protein
MCTARSAIGWAAVLLTVAFNLAYGQSIDQRLKELTRIARGEMRAENTDAEKSAAVLAAFEKRFRDAVSASALQRCSVQDLAALFEANAETVFVTREPRFAMNMGAILQELRSRNKSTAQQFETLYRSLIRARELERAKSLVVDGLVKPDSALPNFVQVSSIVSDKPYEWTISKTGRVAELREVDLSRDWMVVVVSHPNCHFSRRATEDIYADSGLRASLNGHIKWVAPQDGGFDFDVFQAWNSKYPGAEMSVVHRSKDWRLPYFAETPTFYFLSNGKVVTSFRGWPKEGNMKALVAGLDRVRATK